MFNFGAQRFNIKIKKKKKNLKNQLLLLLYCWIEAGWLYVNA